MASKGTVAWVPVLPSLTGFAAKLTSEATQAATTAGTNAGKAFSSTMNAAAGNDTLTPQLKKLKAEADSAKTHVDALAEQTDQLRAAEKRSAQAVKDATQAIGKARDEQKTAALRVEAAEKRLQETVAKYGASSSQAVAAEAKLNDARSRLRQKTEATAKAEDILRAAKHSNKADSEALTGSEKKLADASDKLKGAQSKLADEQTKVDKKSHSLMGRLKQWVSSANAAKTSSDHLAQSTTKLGDVSGKAAGKIGLLAGAAQTVFQKAWGAVSSSVGAAVERTDMMNNFPKVMQNIGFSADDAAKSVQKISDSLDGLPTASSSMTGMVQQLAPLTSSLDEATDISLALNNAMLAGGASTTEQENALTQYCQQLAAGQVDMAAWRSMQAAMPGQLNQLAESMLGAGKNANDLYEEMKDGKISFQDFNKAVVKLNREGFGKYASFADQAKDATQGIGTAVENAKNRVAKAIQKVIEAFGVDKISNAINKFTSSFGKIGDVAADMVKRTIKTFESLYSKLKDIGAIDVLRKAWDKLVHAFDSVKWDKLLPTKTIEGFGWTAAQVIGTIIDNVSLATETLKKGIDKVIEFVQGFTDTGVFDAWIDVFGTVIDVVASVNDLFWECIQNIFGLNKTGGEFESFGSMVGDVFKRIAELIKPVMEKLDDMVNWCRDHSDFVTSALVGIGSAVAGWKIASIVSSSIEWLKQLPAVIAAVDMAVQTSKAVFMSHPIGLIVTVVAAAVAALWWFFSQTETGKGWWANICQFMQDLWQKTCAFFSAMWDWVDQHVIQPFQKAWQWCSDAFTAVCDWIGDAWQTLCDAFQTGWDWVDQYVVQPLAKAWQWLSDVFKTVGDAIGKVWDGIVTAAQIAFLAIATIVLTPLRVAFETVWNTWKWLYETIVRPVWDWIVDKFQAGWDWIDTNVIQPFQLGWNLLKDAFGLVCENISNWWDGAVQALEDGWNWIDQNVVQPFQLGWQVLCDAFKLIGEKIRGAWDAVVGKLRDGWNWINQNVVEPFKTAWQAVKDKFKQVGDGLGSIWDGVKSKFKTVWDWISQHILKPFKDGLKAIGDAAASMKEAASKAFEALKDACATPVRWIVEVVYTNGIQKTWNGIAGAVGLDNLKLPDAPKFAYGGVNPGYAPRHDTVLSWTSPGEAIMVPEWTRAVGAANVHRWNRIARTQGPQALAADMLMPRYADGGISGAWNWVKDKASDAWDWGKEKVGEGWNWVKGKASDIADAVAGFISDPVGWVTSKILEPVRNMIASIGSGHWGSILAQLPLKVAQGLVQKAKDAVSGCLGGGSDGGGEQYHGAVGGGVEQWRPQVLTVLKMLGQDASWADTVLRRMNQESGGNPNAINNWDINAKNGVPSQGLMQTIPPTFAAYAGPFAGRPITDPLANIYAGCNYAIHRYGSLAGMNRPGGYKYGGVVGMAPPTLYDKGGILNPGRTVVENRTRQPELVLTREQVERYFGIEKNETRDVNLTFNIPDRSDPWSQAEIWMREAQNIIGR
ncbi:MAG: tape measure protein [Bifidobacterium castoris]|nr:tape measure protein [Bifidobacterium castoris]